MPGQIRQAGIYQWWLFNQFAPGFMRLIIQPLRTRSKPEGATDTAEAPR